MKSRNKLFILAFIIIACISCQVSLDIDKEKEAIKAVILEESYAFCERDFERIVATYIKDDYNIRMAGTKYGYLYLTGWDDNESFIKTYIENHPEPDPRRAELFDCKIRVYDNVGWAVFKTDEGNIGARFLEKVNGNWKIVFLSAIQADSYKE